ncbi:MAG TPA: hypothetical protein VGM60_21560 [Pseudonocardia sp.]|jgi:hypothetical protein|uniref:hypothetical protein n=1 Tax=Pseudonocardia sp. TaxID=60912 RepID=UPI002F41B704
MGDDYHARHAGLHAELREVRLQGIPRVRALELRWLPEAAGALGYLAPDVPLDLAVEELLRAAVGKLGESPEARAAACTFGLPPQLKMAKAADRRKAAAQAQSVSVETLRKSYERAMMDQLATEILGLISAHATEAAGQPAQAGARPAEVLAEDPLFAKERYVADVLRVARNSADWDLVQGIYAQCVEIAKDHHGRFLPDELPSFFANALGRVSANYQGWEEELVLHGLGVLGDAEHTSRISKALFRQLYADDRFDRFVQYAPSGDPRSSRHRPRPFETLVETARRYRDLNQLHNALADLPTSCILGGSMNYGRYYSVRGNSKELTGTNVDLMIVVPDYGWLDEVLGALSALPGGGRTELLALEQRARVWRDERLDDSRTVFTQRLLMWTEEPDPLMAWAVNGGEYPIDLRIVSLEALDWILVADCPKLTASSAGNARSVRDFCQRERPNEDHLRSFSGRNLRTPLEVDEVQGSLLRTHRVYSIHDDRYYPGTFQNLVLPRFNKRWDNAPIGGRLEAFRWKIIERLRSERRESPYEMLRLSMSHTRSEGFAPHMLDAIDSIDTL